MKRFILVTMLLATAGCDDQLQGPPDEGLPALPVVEVDGVRAAAVVETLDGDHVTIVVRFDEKAVRLGAYQARFTFEPKALALLQVTQPDDGQRFYNDGDAESGVIRFAGFSVDGFGDPVALRMRFRAKQRLRASHVQLAVEVVGTLEGTAMPQQLVTVLPQLHVGH